MDKGELIRKGSRAGRCLGDLNRLPVGNLGFLMQFMSKHLVTNQRFEVWLGFYFKEGRK